MEKNVVPNPGQVWSKKSESEILARLQAVRMQCVKIFILKITGGLNINIFLVKFSIKLPFTFINKHTFFIWNSSF